MRIKGFPPVLGFIWRILLSIIFFIVLYLPAIILTKLVNYIFPANFTRILAQSIDTDAVCDIYGFTGISAASRVKGWYYILHPLDVWEFKLIVPWSESRCVLVQLGWILNGVIGRNDGWVITPFVFKINLIERFG